MVCLPEGALPLSRKGPGRLRQVPWAGPNTQRPAGKVTVEKTALCQHQEEETNQGQGLGSQGQP